MNSFINEILKVPNLLYTKNYIVYNEEMNNLKWITVYRLRRPNELIQAFCIDENNEVWGFVSSIPIEAHEKIVDSCTKLKDGESIIVRTKCAWYIFKENNQTYVQPSTYHSLVKDVPIPKFKVEDFDIYASCHLNEHDLIFNDLYWNYRKTQYNEWEIQNQKDRTKKGYEEDIFVVRKNGTEKGSSI